MYYIWNAALLCKLCHYAAVPRKGTVYVEFQQGSCSAAGWSSSFLSGSYRLQTPGSALFFLWYPLRSVGRVLFSGRNDFIWIVDRRALSVDRIGLLFDPLVRRAVLFGFAAVVQFLSRICCDWCHGLALCVSMQLYCFGTVHGTIVFRASGGNPLLWHSGTCFCALLSDVGDAERIRFGPTAAASLFPSRSTVRNKAAAVSAADRCIDSLECTLFDISFPTAAYLT